VLSAGTLQEYQKRMKKLDQQYKERLRNAGKYLMRQNSLCFWCIQHATHTCGVPPAFVCLFVFAGEELW